MFEWTGLWYFQKMMAPEIISGLNHYGAGDLFSAFLKDMRQVTAQEINIAGFKFTNIVADKAHA